MNQQVPAPAPATTWPDTMYGSLRRASDRVPAGQRAVAGLRNASQWVELSYEELLADIDAVSTHLAALGLQEHDVLCLQLPNWTEAVVYTYAAARLGAVVCPVTTIYRQRELGFILERTECKMVVVPANYRGFDYAAMVLAMVDELPNLREVIAVGETDLAGVRHSADLLVPVPDWTVSAASPSLDDVAILAFTSGTTGESKGVMHSHASIHAVIDDVVEHTGYGTGLTSLVMSPFGHMTGFGWGILMPLRGAGDVVLLETWNADQALNLIDQYGVTFTMGATPFLSDLLDTARGRSGAAFPSIFVCGGAPIPPSLVERAVNEHASRVVAVWGMSEYLVGTATKVTDEPFQASSSDGSPAGRAEVVIVGPDGQPVDVGVEGDLLIRGPGRFLGYYKRPDLDADAFTAEGFLRTGDRARLLDVDGRIRISGRTKDIIIRGGENIPVVEIENVLMTHPDIKEVALVPLPHDRLGETACACMVLQSAATNPPTIRDLGDFLGKQGVAKQFYPEAVRYLAELPRTPSGKIQKFLLREQALETTNIA